MPFSITSREGIQWNEDPISEPTKTFVLTYNSHFVDIRSLPPDSSSFPFDWAFYGEVIKSTDGSGETTYTHDIDSRYINAIATGTKEDAEKFLEADVGSGSNLPNGDEEESGYMLNPDTLKVEKFLEIWRPLYANHAPTKVAKGGRENEESDGKTAKCLVLVCTPTSSEPSQRKFQGKLVRVGSWVQAIVQEIGIEGVSSLSILRAAKANDDGVWTRLVGWGNSLNAIPFGDSHYDQFDEPGKEVTIGGLTWKVVHC